MTAARSLLVSGVGKRNHLLDLIADGCAARGIALVGADATLLAPARASLELFELLPLASDPAFGLAYADLLQRRHIAAFLSIVDSEIPVLAALAESGEFGDARLRSTSAAVFAGSHGPKDGIDLV